MAKSIPARISQRLAACGWIEPIALNAAEEFLHETPAALREMDIVWIDALQQLGLITPTQSEFFYAGREAELTCGQYLIFRKRISVDGVTWYEASSEGQPGYLLAVCDQPLQDRIVTPLAGYRGRIVDSGQVGNRHWVAAILPSGKTLAELLTRYGRMPSSAVIPLLRQIVHQLLSLETAGRTHGRVAPETIFLSADGVASAPFPGLRWPSANPLRKTTDLQRLSQLMRQLLCGIPHGAPPRVPFDSLTDDPLLRELHARQAKPETRLADWFALLGPASESDARQLRNYLVDPPLVLPNLHVHRRQEAAQRRKRNVLAASAAAALLVGCGYFWPSDASNAPASLDSPAPLTPLAAKPLTPQVSERQPSDIHLASIEVPTATSRRIELPAKLTAAEFPQQIAAESTIAAPDGARTTIEIGAEPLRLSAEKLTLERIDFVATSSTGRFVLLEVAAANITLRDCTFRASQASAAESIAVEWRPTSRTSAGLRALPEANLANCRFTDLLIGVDVSASGDAALQLADCRYEGVGGLIRTKAAASPLRFHLQGSGLTTVGGMLWHHFQARPDLPFTANMRISDSQIAPGDNGAAIAVIGGKQAPYAPQVRFDLKQLTIADDAPLATFFDGEQFQPLADDAFSR
ncbi:hypothetical protein LOC68_04980 [Blastopirellula sp. JC732]|uniref:Protein kinase domain-containing protein n=1 Tax=Blastopirellula sediminis TaxID=2894196 RepID=A0A9X1MLK1_9BACT|nr:hypothetical protein [Blastopirellula sediminis]MCC9609484.1 hypothetical protein [Blastopirellula sediminis]MCC9627739.1 hypothetical protein [Blastopirellula sediminis]